MKRNKAVFVTALLAVMLLAILVLIWMLKAATVMGVVVGLLAAVGFWQGVGMVYTWLTGNDEDEDLTPVVVGATTETEDEAELTYEAIRREVEGVT